MYFLSFLSRLVSASRNRAKFCFISFLDGFHFLCSNYHELTLIISSVPIKTATTYKSLTTGQPKSGVDYFLDGSSPPERVVTIRHHLSTPFHKLLAYVASVSVRFRSKERETRVKDCTKNGTSKRAGSRFISRAAKTENSVPRSFFAPKPNGNACYAG